MRNKHDLSPFYITMVAISFFVAVIPILDAFATWVCNFLGLQSIKITTKANEIQEGETTQVQAIGFQVPDEEYCEDDEYE